MLSVRIIGGNTEETHPIKKGKNVQNVEIDLMLHVVCSMLISNLWAFCVDKLVQLPSGHHTESLSEKSPIHQTMVNKAGTTKVCSPMGEKVCSRATPSKVRLAPNFTLRRNEK